MRCLALLAVVSLSAASPDARDIVRRSALLSDQNDQRARMYTFVERGEQREPDGTVKVKTWDVTMLEGSPYRRLIQINDKPLPPAAEKKEQDALRKSIEDRRKESPSARQKRIAEYEKRRARFRDLTKEVADAFDWTIAGEERIAGRPAWVLEGTPRPGYRAKSREAKVFEHFRGKLWIDQTGANWVRIEADAIDTVSFGLFLFRLTPGAHISIEMTRVNDEVWLPKRIAFRGSGRIAGLKKISVDATTTYSGFRRFSTESRIVEAGSK